MCVICATWAEDFFWEKGHYRTYAPENWVKVGTDQFTFAAKVWGDYSNDWNFKLEDKAGQFLADVKAPPNIASYLNPEGEYCMVPPECARIVQMLTGPHGNTIAKAMRVRSS